MSSKCAVTGLPFAGAKAVVLGVPEPSARRAVLDSLAGFVNGFGGRFRTGVDVGLSACDVETMRTATPWMVGTGPIRPDALTADGVFATLKRAVRHRLGRDGLGRTSVGVQGLGKVGLRLARLLLDDGARVLGGDVDRAANEEAAGVGVEIVDPASLIGLDVDVLAPCALGGVIRSDTVGAIRARVIAGSANNQLATADMGNALHERGIFYVPDYLANAGGLIAVAMQIEGHDEAWAHSQAAGLADRLDEIVATADSLGVSIAAAAEQLAADRRAP
eukprot:Cvel_2817.t1-p1 / transcript=Cvel_2817.t1 / gene=Cvel_2817 / organism=Chromera_velia_CCMP2878 / gene_product=Leucine dehydrogenase, putative / transcript_product=Leucine dehydrogenase, putative / location=Cvel_scaffold113:41164-41988(-) / protein_length=275 / sequence_SO=supercontig / SO=protein_coding / is_pseudo=false